MKELKAHSKPRSTQKAQSLALLSRDTIDRIGMWDRQRAKNETLSNRSRHQTKDFFVPRIQIKLGRSIEVIAVGDTKYSLKRYCYCIFKVPEENFGSFTAEGFLDRFDGIGKNFDEARRDWSG